jgi:hypothetical protein
LRAARDIFDSLGCAAWGDQARRELRASGESSRRRDLWLRDELTAQELQIAQLAAEGLSDPGRSEAKNSDEVDADSHAGHEDGDVRCRRRREAE